MVRPELHPRRAPAPASPPTRDDLVRLAAEGLDASPVSEVLIEQSIAGQKEFELEVMRDSADNCVVICSIENLDPMGVHTGDSITVAPAQTLTDVEYQTMRDAAFACIRRVGVETGGSNVQFAVDPADGRQVVIEMNPRVSRSSALASKATGFPIAKIAARLAVGYRLDEITNDITGATPASFEPTIDYVVTKIPRWAFEKLPGVDRPARDPDAVGRRGDGHRPDLPRVAAEGGPLAGAGPVRAQRRSGRGRRSTRCPPTSWWPAAATATPERIFQLEALLRRGVSVDAPGRGHRHRPLVPLGQMAAVTDARMALDLQVTLGVTVDDLDRRAWRRLKRLGFSDQQLAYLFGEPVTAGDIRAARTGPRRRRDLQDGRHLRRRVRGPHPVPLLDHRGRGRGPARPTGPGWSSWGRVPTGSARASSSTTAASTPRSPCGPPATRR